MNTMTEKRFSKFELTQLDDATIDYGVKDSITGKWHRTVDNKTARELTDLLNEQDQKIKELEHELSELHLEKGSAEYYKQLAEEYFEEISKLTYKLNKIKDDIER